MTHTPPTIYMTEVDYEDPDFPLVWASISPDSGGTPYALAAPLLARIEQLEAALKLIANHRKECHEHDDDMGHPSRDFDGEDWRLVEYAARAAMAKEPTP